MPKLPSGMIPGRLMRRSPRSLHTNTIVITAEFKSGFVAKDDLFPLRYCPVFWRFLLGVRTVNSPQSHIVRVHDAGHGKNGVFHSAEWHDCDWSSDGIREAWIWFFIWVESF
ncbi:hypothetical protein TNCV_1058641 [Trichonephila clavipes]|nr:hypothetical protein TNCV_1058641 [Trichonephila clavipes]